MAYVMNSQVLSHQSFKHHFWACSIHVQFNIEMFYRSMFLYTRRGGWVEYGLHWIGKLQFQCACKKEKRGRDSRIARVCSFVKSKVQDDCLHRAWFLLVQLSLFRNRLLRTSVKYKIKCNEGNARCKCGSHFRASNAIGNLCSLWLRTTSSDCSSSCCSLVKEKRWSAIIIGKVDGRFLTFPFRLSFSCSVCFTMGGVATNSIRNVLSFGPFSVNTPPLSRSLVLSCNVDSKCTGQ